MEDTILLDTTCISCHTFLAGSAGSPSLVWPRSRDPHCNRVYLPRRHSTEEVHWTSASANGSTGSLDHRIIGSLDLNFRNHVNISMNLSSAVNCQLPTTSPFFCRGGSRRQSVGRIPILTREPVLYIGSKAGKARSHRATG